MPAIIPFIATVAAVGGTAYAMHQSNVGAKTANSRALDASRAATQGSQSLGNLSTEEATASASKKMFREGLYFTSPTGALGGSRGRSRLMGS
jgi:hypothetical protein